MWARSNGWAYSIRNPLLYLFLLTANHLDCSLGQTRLRTQLLQPWKCGRTEPNERERSPASLGTGLVYLAEHSSLPDSENPPNLFLPLHIEHILVLYHFSELFVLLIQDYHQHQVISVCLYLNISFSNCSLVDPIFTHNSRFSSQAYPSRNLLVF